MYNLLYKTADIMSNMLIKLRDNFQHRNKGPIILIKSALTFPQQTIFLLPIKKKKILFVITSIQQE